MNKHPKVIPISKHPLRKRKHDSEGFSSVKPTCIKWLWPRRIPIGKLSLFVGDPGCGKSLLTTLLAAHISTGQRWPIDHTACPSGKTLLICAEDDAGDTILPRLKAANADLDNVLSLNECEGVDGVWRPFSLLTDVAIVEDILIDHPDLKLIVIDPVSAFLEAADGNSNIAMRAILAPWQALASIHEVSILLITHLNKTTGNNALYRTSGSIALPAACRAVFSLSRSSEDENKRLFLPVKNNLAVDVGGLEFTIEECAGTPVIRWMDEPVTLTSTEALEPPDENKLGTEDCRIWLADYLAEGPQAVKLCIREGSQYGYSSKMLRCAREHLGADSKKIGSATTEKQFWAWQLPATKDDT